MGNLCKGFNNVEQNKKIAFRFDVPLSESMLKYHTHDFFLCVFNISGYMSGGKKAVLGLLHIPQISDYLFQEIVKDFHDFNGANDGAFQCDMVLLKYSISLNILI